MDNCGYGVQLNTDFAVLLIQKIIRKLVIPSLMKMAMQKDLPFLTLLSFQWLSIKEWRVFRRNTPTLKEKTSLLLPYWILRLQTKNKSMLPHMSVMDNITLDWLLTTSVPIMTGKSCLKLNSSSLRISPSF